MAQKYAPYHELSVASMTKLYNTYGPDPRERFSSRRHGIKCLARLVKEGVVREADLNRRAGELLRSGKATATRRTRNAHGVCGVPLKVRAKKKRTGKSKSTLRRRAKVLKTTPVELPGEIAVP